MVETGSAACPWSGRKTQAVSKKRCRERTAFRHRATRGGSSRVVGGQFPVVRQRLLLATNYRLPTTDYRLLPQ